MKTRVAWAALHGAIASALLLCGSPAVAQVKQFDIPTEDAGKSIPELARQAGIQVIAPGDQLHGIVTPAIKGTYDVTAALNLMLRGTGLVVSRSADGIVTISLPEPKGQEEWEGMLKEHKNSVSVLALFFAALTGTSAQAQTDQPLETVVVTGVRASMQSALTLKKNSDQIEDSVVAEDIGKLPDNNVIEALQHVTGVQVSRNASEANQLLIRGLPDIATLLNGREIFTSTGRFVSLQDIPAELLARVDVKKSPTADDLEGGIAGLIDVTLHRPFDFDGLKVAGSLRGRYSNLSGHGDPVANVLVSNRWQTGIGEIGVLLDVTYSRDHYKQEILDNYISSQRTWQPCSGTTAADGLCGVPLTQGAQSISGKRERAAVDLSVQWRPNQNAEFYADLFYTRYRNPNNVSFFVGLPWICSTNATASPGTDEVKTLTAGCYDLTSNQTYRPKTDTYQLATGGTWTSGNLTLTTEFDYTDSKYYQNYYYLDTHYDPGVYEMDVNYNGTGTPYMKVTEANVTDPTNMVFRTLGDTWTKQTGNEIDWRGDLKYEFGSSAIKSIEGGIRYANRFAKNRQATTSGMDCDGAPATSSPFYALQVARNASEACGPYRRVQAADGSWSTVPNGSGITLSDLPGSYHVTGGSIFDGKFGITDFMTVDPEWLYTHIGDVRQMFGQSASAPATDPTQSFDDREISWSAYAKVNFGFDLGIVPIDGNIGLRVVDTDAKQKANVLVATEVSPDVYTFAYSPTVSEKETADWMPSLNVRAKLQDDFYIRLGLSRTVTRPTFAQLNPGLSLSASTATLLGSGESGNPNVAPVKSDNADLTFEYYFGASNTVNLALFHRRVHGYIAVAVAAETIGGITYQIRRPANQPDGDINGVEIGYTQFFDFLPGIWSGFGVQANGTYVDGAFTNISKYSYNLVGIYEYGPISLRAAYNWRAGFSEGAADGGGTNPSTVYAKSQPWLDVSASYKYNDRLTFTFDATNLLDSYFQDSFGKGAEGAVYPRDTRRFDQTISLGLRYKL